MEGDEYYLKRIPNSPRWKSLEKWQQRWSDGGRWTRTLILNIGRRHGEIKYYLIQFVSGCGSCRIQDHSPFCREYGCTPEDLERVRFHGPPFCSEVSGLEGSLEISISNIVREILKAEVIWWAVIERTHVESGAHKWGSNSESAWFKA